MDHYEIVITMQIIITVFFFLSRLFSLKNIAQQSKICVYLLIKCLVMWIQ